MLKIYCKNTRSSKQFNEGTTLEEMLTPNIRTSKSSCTGTAWVP